MRHFESVGFIKNHMRQYLKRLIMLYIYVKRAYPVLWSLWEITSANDLAASGFPILPLLITSSSSIMRISLCKSPNFFLFSVPSNTDQQQSRICVSFSSPFFAPVLAFSSPSPSSFFAPSLSDVQNLHYTFVLLDFVSKCVYWVNLN